MNGRIVENEGRYMLKVNRKMKELTAGMVIEVYLGGHWIPGYVGETADYFVSDIGGAYGGICGLWDGMQIRIQEMQQQPLMFEVGGQR